MALSLIPCVIMTVFWGVVAFIGPFVAPKGPNRGVIQLALVLTGACCWLFWLCAYMAQMNPLIGPKLKNTTLLLIAQQWGNAVVQ